MSPTLDVVLCLPNKYNCGKPVKWMIPSPWQMVQKTVNSKAPFGTIFTLTELPTSKRILLGIYFG